MSSYWVSREREPRLQGWVRAQGEPSWPERHPGASGTAPLSSDLQVLQILQLRHLLDLGFIGHRDSEHLVPGQSGGA